MSALPATPEVTGCRHCGAALEEALAPFCCAGCELAARIIEEAGLDRYYAEREAFAPRPTEQGALDLIPSAALQDGSAEVRFQLEGLRCASCVWVAEKVLERTPGVREARVSYGSGRGRVVFDPELATVGQVLGRVADLGYGPRPLVGAEGGEPDRDLLLRLGVAIFAAANVMLISAGVYAGWLDGMDPRHSALFRWTALALATPAATWSALPFFAGAWRGLRAGVLHMDLPISLGVAVMYVHAVGATLAGHEGYLDSLTMLVAFLLAGRVLEARGRRRAREAAESLAGALPRIARRATEGGVERVPVEQLAAGDRLALASGEEVGADGVVEQGQGQVRMALLTGESEPAVVGPGDRLVAGALVVEGALTLRVEATGGSTLLERMAEDLRRASDREVRGLVPDKLAPAFTAATLVLAALTFGGWWLWAGATAAVAPTVAVLVVACPCALALAQPLSVAAGLGAAARRGLLLRSGDALLGLADVDVAVLDKTGTVTLGEMVVVEAEPAALRIAAGIERYSLHPVGRAIVEEAIRRGIPLPRATDVHEQPGVGISGVVDGRTWRLRAGGPGEVLLLGEGTHEVIRLRDAVRPDAARTIRGMSDLGLQVVLLTGDHPHIAERIAEEAGIERWSAGVDPQGKRAWIEDLQVAGHRVLVAGDGLNDGPALAASDVAVAMSSGATSSLLVADGVVAEPSLGPVLAGLRAGRHAARAIRSNIGRSLAYNVLAVAAAAAGFVNPLVAALLMPLSSALVVHGALGVERRMRKEEQWTR